MHNRAYLFQERGHRAKTMARACFAEARDTPRHVRVPRIGKNKSSARGVGANFRELCQQGVHTHACLALDNRGTANVWIDNVWIGEDVEFMSAGVENSETNHLTDRGVDRKPPRSSSKDAGAKVLTLIPSSLTTLRLKNRSAMTFF